MGPMDQLRAIADYRNRADQLRALANETPRPEKKEALTRAAASCEAIAAQMEQELRQPAPAD